MFLIRKPEHERKSLADISNTKADAPASAFSQLIKQPVRPRAMRFDVKQETS